MGAIRYRSTAYGIAAETQLNSGFVAKGIWGKASDPHTVRDIANKTSPPQGGARVNYRSLNSIFLIPFDNCAGLSSATRPPI